MSYIYNANLSANVVAEVSIVQYNTHLLTKQ